MYAAHVRPHTKGRPSQWGDAWVAGTIRFGWGMAAIGAVLLALCWFLPRDERLWFCVGLGVLTTVVGLWHVRHAASIDALARGRQVESL